MRKSSKTMVSLDFLVVPRPVAAGSSRGFSVIGDENSRRALSVFLSLAFLVLGGACGGRPVTTGTTLDGGSGGATGTGGAGTGGGQGGGTDGSIPTDGGINCANVGCAASPLCSVGCHESCGCCPCNSGERKGNLICTGGCYAPVPADASVDQSLDQSTDGSPADAAERDGNADAARADAGRADASSDAAVCDGIRSDYASALRTAQECTLGAANQCGLSVRSGFFCNCLTFANSAADVLAALVATYEADGCPLLCVGSCVQVRALSCLADATSSTGGRCLVPGVLNLGAADNGGAFSVAVGEEVDIMLESIAPGSYSTSVRLSSDDATIIEIAIPAGPPNANGANHLYRLRATSAGQLEVEIPFEPAASGSPQRTYAVTINAH